MSKTLRRLRRLLGSREHWHPIEQKKTSALPKGSAQLMHHQRRHFHASTDLKLVHRGVIDIADSKGPLQADLLHTKPKAISPPPGRMTILK